MIIVKQELRILYSGTYVEGMCPLMKKEIDRIQSYVTFPNCIGPRPLKLAKSGFYFTNQGDIVKCFSCGVKYSDWKHGDVAEFIHRRISPNCLHVQGLDNYNQAIQYSERGVHHHERQEARKSQNVITPSSTMHKELSTAKKNIYNRKQTNQSIRAKYPEYLSVQTRINSFSSWTQPQSIHTLSEAGFFYTGKSDFVRCFSCGGGLKNWENGDDPWIEHARWFPSCQFLKQSKGNSFIEMVKDQSNIQVNILTLFFIL